MMQKSANLATETHILDSLYFSQMHSRHGAIKDTYADTFSWIFEEKSTNFKTWLEEGSGIFRVRGKAGSGKSTLMKYLSDNAHTERILQRWASQKKLVTASYYLWIAGRPEQKSQEGLLQGLLYQLLSQCPEIIPIATPERWQTNELLKHRRPRWNRKELSAALKAVLAPGQLSARFCFFIDGLDEYCGEYHELTKGGQNIQIQADHYALIRDLEGMVQSNDVKICVSSRPWNPFRSAFGGEKERLLILEDLTQNDMAEYIKGMLEEDSRHVQLAQRDSRAGDLISEIRDKAEGVFLWVFLAVRSLLRGMSEDDDIAELTRRLRRLPSDLKEFFHRILQSIDAEYRTWPAAF